MAKSLYSMKTKVFNHQRFKKHWQYTSLRDAERYAIKLGDEGYIVRITVAYQNGKFYVLWKKKRQGR